VRVSRRLLWPLAVLGAALVVERLARREPEPTPPRRVPVEPDVRLDRSPMEMRPAPRPPAEAPRPDGNAPAR
jgi:hypothetical protein